MKTYRYMIGMLLCVWLLAACDNSNAFDEYAKFDTTAQTAWGQSIVDGSNGYVAHVKSDRTYNLADGVDVLEMAFLADDGLAMQLFLFKIALSDKITLRTTLADDKNQVGTGQTIMKQHAAAQERRAAGPERQHDAGGEHGAAYGDRRVAGRQGGLPDGGRRP